MIEREREREKKEIEKKERDTGGRGVLNTVGERRRGRERGRHEGFAVETAGGALRTACAQQYGKRAGGWVRSTNRIDLEKGPNAHYQQQW